jgi:hypothetical protein
MEGLGRHRPVPLGHKRAIDALKIIPQVGGACGRVRPVAPACRGRRSPGRSRSRGAACADGSGIASWPRLYREGVEPSGSLQKVSDRRLILLFWIYPGAREVSLWPILLLHFHSITSSARTSRIVGISRPSVLAVRRLITRSNLVGCTTGNSPTFSPFRMRPT